MLPTSILLFPGSEQGHWLGEVGERLKRVSADFLSEGEHWTWSVNSAVTPPLSRFCLPKALFTIPRPAQAFLPAPSSQLYDVPAHSRGPPAIKVSLVQACSPASPPRLWGSQHHVDRRSISASPTEDLWRECLSAPSSQLCAQGTQTCSGEH